MRNLLRLFWCFYKRSWCLIFPSVIVFSYSFWVFILPFQLFENYYFGTLKLNSIHISQRFSVDSFGNYASCGQIDFSWGESWETLEIEHLHKVLGESVFILIAKEGCELLDGDFPGWFPVGSVVSLMVVHSHQTVSQDDCGHLENCACNPWLFARSSFLSKALLWKWTSEAHWSSDLHYFLYTDFAPAIKVVCINTLKEN